MEAQVGNQVWADIQEVDTGCKGQTLGFPEGLLGHCLGFGCKEACLPLDRTVGTWVDCWGNWHQEDTVDCTQGLCCTGQDTGSLLEPGNLDEGWKHLIVKVAAGHYTQVLLHLADSRSCIHPLTCCQSQAGGMNPESSMNLVMALGQP